MSFFFFNDTATTEIYTLSLHYALPISDAARRLARPAARRPDAEEGPDQRQGRPPHDRRGSPARGGTCARGGDRDRKSTRLNSSHANISYAVFCLKKKKLHTIADYVDGA